MKSKKQWEELGQTITRRWQSSEVQVPYLFKSSLVGDRHLRQVGSYSSESAG